MGRVSISCCDWIYRNDGTSGGQSGTVRCGECGCSFGWTDLGQGRVKTWTEMLCEEHGGDGTRTVLCERCKGKGEHQFHDRACGVCGGTGLVLIESRRRKKPKHRLDFD